MRAGASTSPAGVIVSEGGATFRAYNRDFLTKPRSFGRDSVAICRDRRRRRQELLEAAPPALTRPDPCLLPWAMLLQRCPIRSQQLSGGSRSAASSGASQRPGRSQHPRSPSPEGGKPFFSGRGCSEGGIQRIPALPMEPLCASAAPDLSRRRGSLGPKAPPQEEAPGNHGQPRPPPARPAVATGHGHPKSLPPSPHTKLVPPALPLAENFEGKTTPCGWSGVCPKSPRERHLGVGGAQGVN